MLRVLVCVVLLSVLTARTGGQQSESSQFSTLYWLAIILCIVMHVFGCAVYLSLGSAGPNITTDNTEILITDIGEEDDALPRLTCHTDSPTCCRSIADNGGNGGLGQWTYPDGSMVLNNADSMTAGDGFYFNRVDPQVIHLNRRETNNRLSPTGSYCCTVPTNGGVMMTLCANLGE